MAEEGSYVFKYSGQQIDSLLGKVNNGFIYMVDNTKLDFDNIDERDDKSVTQDECDEVTNIVSQYQAGKVVTVVSESQSGDGYRYGVLNVRADVNMLSISLIFYDYLGNLKTYTLDDGASIGSAWSIVKKTNDYTILPVTQSEYDALSTKDSHTLYIIKG